MPTAYDDLIKCQQRGSEIASEHIMTVYFYAYKGHYRLSRHPPHIYLAKRRGAENVGHVTVGPWKKIKHRRRK